ncbi:MAG: hypothetical protein K5880_02250 [Hydrogenophaga sp.]|uniref:hypothetical protein n=1 Tax=Hydrogenophaga sp. TaxID=1904254 RepID=UPI002615A652|nr:hypothetical protein [Hydrogenophaga sp.]MCV0437425.1 hypothetical protein [Hydrogenophaga sp.]
MSGSTIEIDSINKLYLEKIEEIRDFLLRIELISKINDKHFGVTFSYSADPFEPAIDLINIEKEIEIFESYKSGYHWYRSKKSVFRNVPDAIASAARLSRYYCLHKVDHKEALRWLLQAHEKKGIVEYQLTRTQSEKYKDAFKKTSQLSTDSTKQAVLLGVYGFTPSEQHMSRSKIVDACIPEIQKIIEDGRIQPSCEIESIINNVNLWIHRDDEFKKHFLALEEVIRRGESPKKSGFNVPFLEVFTPANSEEEESDEEDDDDF